jgi:diguanylate cyclase (GGDEF)-like protein
MDSFTNQQLQTVISQIDQAIYNHDQWYKNLLRVLVSHLPPDEADMMPDAHLRCRFGQWYDSPQSTFIQNDPAFLTLGEAHENMHSSARTLLQRATDGKPIPISDWDMFDNKLEKMRLEFHALRHEFASIAQNRDSLTEAQNRASMLPGMRDQQALVQRGRQTCALVMFDLDHFKRVNDEYGHAAGDKVLVSTVRCLKAILRPYDRIYRYGGEEFIVCMPSTSLEQAHVVAERMRTAIEAERIQYDDSSEPLQVRASFGVTVLTKTRTVEESIDSVDKAMYKAKVSGRNRVVDDNNNETHQANPV